MFFSKRTWCVFVIFGFSWCPLSGCTAVGPMQHETKTIDLDQSAAAHVTVSMGAGELTVEGGTPKLLDAAFDYNVPEWKPTVEYRTTSSGSDLTISQPSEMHTLGNTKNTWNLKLNDRVPMELVTHLGAGEAQMRLASLTLRHLELNIGAGKVEVDLRGAPTQSYDARIQGGVGQAIVHLPKSVGISATVTGGLGSIDVQGLEKHDSRWINAGHESDPVTIRLDVKGGIGEIRIVAQ